jgi:hypothetical protein
MSDSSSAVQVSRGKVWLHMAVGEAFGRPLAEWAYRTPRFPQGIKGSDLLNAAPEIQRETMVVWFLANHHLAAGPYFGFSGQTAPTQSTGSFNTHPLNSAPINQGIEVVGFGQGPFFSGGQAPDLLKAEFAEFVAEQVILEVAGLFEGLWQRMPSEPFVDFDKQTPEEQITTLVSNLDELTEIIHKMLPAHGGIGHNGSPPITEDETRIVLRATAEARLAVLSSDYRAAHLAWEAISPIVKKLGNSIAKQVDNYCTKFTSALAVASALMATGYIGYELGFWNKAEAIGAMLEIAKHLPH